jgi:hypothetical protein
MRTVTGTVYLPTRARLAFLRFANFGLLAALLLTTFVFAPPRLRVAASVPSPTTAAFTQTTGGSPSIIDCHDLPSSLEPYTLPLRVPK